MKMRAHYAILVLFVFIYSSCSKEFIESTDTTIETSVNVTAIEAKLLVLVNEYRNSSESNSLSYSAVAYEYANVHTDYMIAKGSINHDNFSKRASDITTKVNAKQVAENVAKDHNSAIDAFEGWLNSKPHREAIEGDFTHTAVSVKKSKDGQLYFTQLFYKE